MDETGLGVLCNMDGGFGATFDRNMTVGEPFKDRVLPRPRSLAGRHADEQGAEFVVPPSKR
jgi:hypothetical protein